MFNRFAVFTTLLCAAVLASTANLQGQNSEMNNVVLVHGARADGSGWRGVYDNVDVFISASTTCPRRRCSKKWRMRLKVNRSQ
jgi:hypothetical protein